MEENNQTPPPVQSSPFEQNATVPTRSENARKGKRKVLIGIAVIFITLIFFVAANFTLLELGLIDVDQNYISKLDSLPTPTSTPDPTANWKTYTNSAYGYSIGYPKELSLQEREGFIEIDKQILITVSNNNPAECRGGCPISESTIDKEIGDLSGSWDEGYIGEIGGNMPQKYQRFFFSKNNRYYIFTLYELRTDASIPLGRSLEKIPSERTKLFEQILLTFKFTN